MRIEEVLSNRETKRKLIHKNRQTKQKEGFESFTPTGSQKRYTKAKGQGSVCMNGTAESLKDKKSQNIIIYLKI